MQDLKTVVLKIAKFLGYAYSDDVISKIVEHCSFSSMKNNPMTNPDALFKQVHGKLGNEDTTGKADSTLDAKEKTIFYEKRFVWTFFEKVKLLGPLIKIASYTPLFCQI